MTSAPSRPSFGTAARRPVQVEDPDVVRTDLFPGCSLPLVVQPSVGNVDLVQWAALHRSWIDARLRRHGALLFRGFAIAAGSTFSAFVRATCEQVVGYDEPTTPRTRVSEDLLYTSTDYPASERISPHNERSYSLTVPMKLYFWCDTPPQRGGATPIGDSRKVLLRLPAPARDAFAAKGWSYVRCFQPGLGLSWEQVFQTGCRDEVEAFCRANEIACQWTDTGLRTEQIRAAIETHPVTGEQVWFNHAAFFHASMLPAVVRERLVAEGQHGAEPNQTYFGDGAPIADHLVDQIQQAYRLEQVPIEWQRGDVLLLDNLLAFHAREPFEGPRRILVAMADPYTRPSPFSIRERV